MVEDEAPPVRVDLVKDLITSQPHRGEKRYVIIYVGLIGPDQFEGGQIMLPKGIVRQRGTGEERLVYWLLTYNCQHEF